jgi:hypothetical protein
MQVVLWGLLFILQAAQMIYWTTRPGFAQRADLAVIDSGLQGSIDGRPVLLPWNSLSEARMTASAMFIEPKIAFAVRNKRLAIPLAALAQSGAVLWAELERRLVPKGVVRSSFTPNVIYNSAA